MYGYEMLGNRLMDLMDKVDTLKGQERIDCLAEMDMINEIMSKGVQETISHRDKIAKRFKALVKHYTNK